MIRAIAGEDLKAGAIICIGLDGMAYNSRVQDPCLERSKNLSPCRFCGAYPVVEWNMKTFTVMDVRCICGSAESTIDAWNKKQ